MANKLGPKSPMSDEHKAALARGRVEGKVVRDYLEALRANKPKRGRKRTAESVTNRLTAIEDELASASPIDELRLIQERRDLEQELAQMQSGTVDISELEDKFVDIAASYSDSKGISYATCRDVSVSASVLRRAGVSRAG